MLRALIHHWRINLAVLLGAAVATAVLAGALIVGDSIRGSLRDLTLERLGGIDQALVSARFFRESLAEEFASGPEFAGRFAAVAPAVLLRGAIVHAESGNRASRVGIQGVDGRFLTLFGGARPELGRAQGQLFPSVVINAGLARELGASAGDALLLGFGTASEIPRATLVGDSAPDDLTASLRLIVRSVIPDEGLGRFGLAPEQQTPLNAFVELAVLQRALDRGGRVNALFVSVDSPAAQPDALLERIVQVDDAGLVIHDATDHLRVESREFVLRPELERAVRDAATAVGAPFLEVQSYLANALRANGRSVPYSTVAALDAHGGADWSALPPVGNLRPPDPGPDGILLGRWAADDLEVGPGDPIELDYFEVGPSEELREQSVVLSVRAILPLKGLAADRNLTPEYPGIEESGDIADWDPPFPVDLGRVRPKDEAYWDRHGATPKAFVSAETGRRLWATRFGSVTSVRIGPAPGLTLDDTRSRVTTALRERLTLADLGLGFRPVKTEGLRAARGATDFAGLFVAFSFFLIVSAALLVGLLFGLGVERRSREVGLLLAVGYPLPAVRRRLLAEGALVALAGGLVGVAGGLGYAWLLLAGLRTLWLPAVGSSRLFLHVAPGSLPLGLGLAMVVVIFSIRLALRRLSRIPVASLLAGSFRVPDRRRRRAAAPWIAGGSGAAALLLIGYAAASGSVESPALAFGAGALLLVAGLAGFAAWARRSGGRALAPSRSLALLRMAARNGRWNPGRSVLSVALIASACFVIVTVAASRREPAGGSARNSGGGGYALVAESDVPLYQDLGREDRRFELGFDAEAEGLLRDATIVPLRLLPGDDASCLNLYRPERPRLLGVPPALVERGGFRFAQHADLPPGVANPWTLLEQDLEPGVIAAIGDANSVRWILHLGLGRELTLRDEAGQPVRLRLVGLLDTSIFQGELLIAERDFVRHFPSRGGYSYFLIDAPAAEAPRIATALERTLQPFGLDAVTTGEKLAGYLVVEHTYLSTFQMLGALGLLLGTVGLGVVLLRNVIERRGELATLRAFGFRRGSLAWLVLAENGFLLLAGVGIGTVSALAAVAPRLATTDVPWGSLLPTLCAVLLVGMLASAAAVAGALRTPLLPALKEER